ncbi:CHAT domain-containing protein [Lentibacter sp. XHP0401]|uniref:CHAT domain-containing protein n=1 Tax=Lentibacter sp. XHP0401 TaxID=2984334 RepID=UPI0021E9A6B3|nr:CHAT domain-containing protein [Lentibacter sp. XHP0401]MCV2894623.1 CHAT domain-containing protein [Lentibacter sp. XHP0401]
MIRRYAHYLLLLLLAYPAVAQETMRDLSMRAMEQSQAKDFAEAAQSLEQAIALYDRDGLYDPFLLSDLYFYKAAFEYGAENRNAALVTMDQAGTRTPFLTKRLPEMANLRGNILIDLGLFQMAAGSYRSAANYMIQDSWSDRFSDQTVQQMRLLSAYASSRAAFILTEKKNLTPLEEALAELERLMGAPFPQGRLMRLRVLEAMGRVLEAREGLLSLAISAPSVRPAALSMAAMIDWRLGNRARARTLAEDALALANISKEHRSLMQFLHRLDPETTDTETAIDLMTSSMQYLAPPEGQSNTPTYLAMETALQMMLVGFDYLEGLPDTAETLAPGDVDLSILSSDGFPQDNQLQRLIFDIRLLLAEHFERGGHNEAARAEYNAIRMQFNVRADTLARALAGLGRVGLDENGVYSEYQMRAQMADQAFEVAAHFLTSIPARQSQTLKRQIVRYSAVMEQAIDAGYETLRQNPPWGPCEGDDLLCRQTGPFVFPWEGPTGEGYVGLSQGGTHPGLLQNVFRQIQTVRHSEAGQAIAVMTERLATGDDALAILLRQRDTLIAARSLAAAQGVSGQAEVSRLDKKLDEIERQLATRHPGFASQAALTPLTMTLARDLLEPDEALVLYLTTGAGLHVFAVTPEHVIWHRSDVSRPWLRDAVDRLRQGLNPARIVRGAMPLGQTNEKETYDLDLAHALYSVTLAPLAGHLPKGGVVLISPDDALQTLPFGVLVSAAAKDIPGGLNGTVPWAIRDYAFATLPAASSLKNLRKDVVQSLGSLAFLGLGNPEFDASAQGVQLAPLPETEEELERLSTSIAAGAGRLLLGQDATKEGLRQASPAEAKVLAFATHGLLGGEASELGEPALALTPGTDGTDGLLRASEIATFSLNADWVILSACNTASGPTADSTEGLSGLARAFFYAGARRLLVSHWPVQSDATVALTTSMFAALTSFPEETPPSTAGAQALRTSMLSMIDKPQNPKWAHPSAWGPFVVAGG